jgi:hypothetical protein
VKFDYEGPKCGSNAVKTNIFRVLVKKLVQSRLLEDQEVDWTTIYIFLRRPYMHLLIYYFGPLEGEALYSRRYQICIFI